MLRDLRAFLLRGNILDLAVAVILGIAFNAIVTAFVHFLMDVIGSLFGEPDFDALAINVGGDRLVYGPILTAIVNFLFVGTALFLIIRVASRLQRPQEESPTPDSDEVVLLREIRDTLRHNRGI